MYVVPRISPALAAAAAALPDVLVVGVDDGVIIEDGQSRRANSDPSELAPSSPPRYAWGRFAVMRALVQHPGRRQVDLAAITGVSQAAVSKALGTIGSVAIDARAGSRQAAERLWDRFLAEYPGPRGITTNWYSLDPPTHQSAQVQARHPEALISGDAGADELAPWRAVRRAKMYAATGLELAELGFAEADPADATLAMTVPDDHTVFATARAWHRNPRAALTADPMIVAWDVSRIGGADADEAAAKLRALAFEAWP